jgi:hypothetical protein
MDGAKNHFINDGGQLLKPFVACECTNAIDIEFHKWKYPALCRDNLVAPLPRDETEMSFES